MVKRTLNLSTRQSHHSPQYQRIQLQPQQIKSPNQISMRSSQTFGPTSTQPQPPIPTYPIPHHQHHHHHILLLPHLLRPKFYPAHLQPPLPGLTARTTSPSYQSSPLRRQRSTPRRPHHNHPHPHPLTRRLRPPLAPSTPTAHTTTRSAVSSNTANIWIQRNSTKIGCVFRGAR